MKFLYPILFLTLALSACQTRPDVVQELACGSQNFMGYVGQNAANVVLPAGANMRVISPGAAVDSDYVYDRVNLVTDTKGIIREIACG